MIPNHMESKEFVEELPEQKNKGTMKIEPVRFWLDGKDRNINRGIFCKGKKEVIICQKVDLENLMVGNEDHYSRKNCDKDKSL